MACFKTISISVLWNGQTSRALSTTPEEFVKVIHCHLIHPLSHYLSFLLDATLHTKILQPVRVNRRALNFKNIYFYRWHLFIFPSYSPTRIPIGYCSTSLVYFQHCKSVTKGYLQLREKRIMNHLKPCLTPMTSAPFLSSSVTSNYSTCWLVPLVSKKWVQHLVYYRHVAPKSSFSFKNIIDITLFLYFCFILVLW